MDEVVEAPAAAPAAPAAAPAPADAPAAAPAPAPTALAAHAAAPAPAATPAAPAPAPGPNDWAPEKHRVFKEDGVTLDESATARKIANAYHHAEKRIGSGDVPPESADKYALNVPEGLKDRIKGEDLAKSEDVKAFVGKCHAAGYTQAQIDVALGELLERGVKMREAQPVMDAAECTATLRQLDGWKTDQEYQAQMGKAYRAAAAYAGDQAELDAFLAKHGNDPVVARMLAKIGAELAEDTQASAEASAQLNQNLDELMRDPAYLDDRHPKHALIKSRVDALHERLAGTRESGPNRTMSFKS